MTETTAGESLRKVIDVVRSYKEGQVDLVGLRRGLDEATSERRLASRGVAMGIGQADAEAAVGLPAERRRPRHVSELSDATRQAYDAIDRL